MKSVLAAIIAVCLFLSASMQAFAATPASSIDKAEASTIIVFGDVLVTQPPDPLFNAPAITRLVKNVPFCSGVLAMHLADYDIFVTAGHCVSKTSGPGGSINLRPRSVKFNDGTHYAVVNYVRAKNDDIGILVVSPSTRPAVTINTSGLERGADYFIFSMPNGFAWSYTPATSMQGDKSDHEPSPWQGTNLITCPGCGPGDSGGGLFDSEGDLVGITVAGGGAYSLSVPSLRVLNDLQDTVL